ncbi:MAG: 30S ribosomal protein S27e [Nanoarchaeota archaeon]|nr:30S ribosomal protein S27e [Nanoarchaeota archaeon]
MVSKFLKIKCEKCKNEQIIFEKANKDVNCLVCNTPLAKSTGGKVRVDAKSMKVLE